MTLTAVHIIGILLTVGLLVAIGLLSGRGVKDARSFAIGGKANSWMVCGIIMGTLVGGQSTIGTAQMAFCYGLSAWWFTIGAALGSAVLGLVYVVPLRRSGCVTLAEIVAKEYGHKAETIGSLLCMMGIFISIVSQVLASSAMITTLFRMPTLWGSILSVLLIVIFIFFGGIRSAGLGGILKVVLLYVASITSAVIVFGLTGGLDGVWHDLSLLFQQPQVAENNGIADACGLHDRYGNIVGRGVLKDVGSGLSLLLGVLATQTYAQGIWAARGYRQARRGALLSALLVPIIGAACTLVGLYMRGHYITTDEQTAILAAGESIPDGIRIINNTAEVFPRFILDCCPPWIGGIVIGTLFVTVLGGGSGLTLGAVTILVHNVVNNIRRPNGKGWGEASRLYRAGIVIIASAALAVSLASHRTLINDLGFLSLGLRATALLLPITTALFMPGAISRQAVITAMIAGTAMMMVASLLNLPSDPIFYGIGTEVFIAATDLMTKKYSKHNN